MAQATAPRLGLPCFSSKCISAADGSPLSLISGTNTAYDEELSGLMMMGEPPAWSHSPDNI